MGTQIRLAGVVGESIVDGPGIRMTIFAQGCPHHCPGCHNPQTHDFEAGTLWDTDDLLAMVKKNPLLKGVTFSGGEPFCQAGAFALLGEQIHALGRNIMTYTGYTLEKLLEENDPDRMALLRQTDFLVDGPFILAQKKMTLQFRGSENQRILDVKRSLETGKAVPADWQR